MNENSHKPPCAGAGTRPGIAPGPIRPDAVAADLIDETFLAYNGGRLREAARLLAERVLRTDVCVGLSLAGALTPAGLGLSCIVPLIEAGFVDWITTTGANIYHDMHFAYGHPVYAGSPFEDDMRLKESGMVRIYDVILRFNDMLEIDEEIRRSAGGMDVRKAMSTAEFHHRLGGELHRWKKERGTGAPSVLETAFLHDVPVYTPAPGDSNVVMNVAELALRRPMFQLDVSLDVNETGAIVFDAKRSGGKSAVFILGGGVPKNFMLQTEPYIQDILRIDDPGHDYFIQITDARPDTGGLSGATPSEAVSWGKIDPGGLPDTVVCYTDVTIALPLLTAYVMTKAVRREPRRLYRRLDEMVERLRSAYEQRLSREGG